MFDFKHIIQSASNTLIDLNTSNPYAMETSCQQGWTSAADMKSA